MSEESICPVCGDTHKQLFVDHNEYRGKTYMNFLCEHCGATYSKVTDFKSKKWKDKNFFQIKREKIDK